MSNAGEDPALNLEAVFLEPPRPPSPEPTLAIYSRAAAQDSQLHTNDEHLVWSKIEIRLVGSHPLWGHYLWNAARSFASYLDAHPDLYQDKCVLELGAGGGLPGIVTVKNGAKLTVLTDYPDAPLLENLRHNVAHNVPAELSQRVFVEGYIWGKPLELILNKQQTTSNDQGFDLIIMSDLIFNHSQHDALLTTAELALKPSTSTSTPQPSVLVFYSHHRPHLAHRDMEFFSKAQERGWACEKILTEQFPPMFPEDPGEEEVRATVHGWRLVRYSSIPVDRARS
ncbi:putative methyltransferase-domain-containing protein [Irpex rosettiformis]|uniref:Methyltransferase-domain-containing protein n=1 Tax=Irpex rosettiformis TaxID=378272 RepID=A0ACB8U2F3_9APHY|nr:putative methyltransferase-domain-containing protein [Irpex rosettiformis]